MEDQDANELGQFGYRPQLRRSLVHLFGIRLASRVNDLGDWTELIGVTLLSLGLVGAWCLTGFEAARDLAEKTRQPRRVVPAPSWPHYHREPGEE